MSEKLVYLLASATVRIGGRNIEIKRTAFHDIGNVDEALNDCQEELFNEFCPNANYEERRMFFKGAKVEWRQGFYLGKEDTDMVRINDYQEVSKEEFKVLLKYIGKSTQA